MANTFGKYKRYCVSSLLYYSKQENINNCYSSHHGLPSTATGDCSLKPLKTFPINLMKQISNLNKNGFMMKEPEINVQSLCDINNNRLQLCAVD